MSHTVSRGYHFISHWLTPAIVVEAGLRTSSDPPPHYKGALIAIEQFFDWVLDGIATNNGALPIGERPSTMAGVCAFSYAFGIIIALGNEREAALSMTGQVANHHLSVLKRLMDHQALDSEVITQLRLFLVELIRQGERDRADRIFAA